MITRRPLEHIGLTLLMLAFASGAQGAATSIATAPLITSASASVLPNLMFILDDSGSMGWDYLPDWANDNSPWTGSSYSSAPELFRNNGFNGVAYNPAITYSPPSKYNSDGTINSTTYPNLDGLTTSKGADSSAKPNWKAVKNDGYGIQSTSNSDLTSNAYFYTFIPGEYCATPNLRSCNAQTAPSASYPYPATLRWCTSSAMSNCQAIWISGSYTVPRYPQQPTSTISISNSSSSTVNNITVNGQRITSASSGNTSSTSTMATNIAALINNCTTALSGNCQVAGYSASASGSTVTITAPATVANSYNGNSTYRPSVDKTGSMTFSTNNFSGGVGPGRNVRVDIVSSNNSYPYPGSTEKAATRTDCAGTTCTYVEAMTNYANWWAYYHTRMQMMKTTTSRAFSPVDSTFKVGYLSINNNTGSDFLNILQFTTAQKNSWYDKLFAARPNSFTPLRASLSQAGRLYAGKLNGTSLNGSTVTDPMEYSCQQNFTLLSTDGYWNSNAGYQLNGSTAIGNQDRTEPRPFYDGTSVTYSKSTSQLQQSQTQTTQSTSQLQSRTEQLQRRTSTLQQQTSQLQQDRGTLQSQTSQLQTSTSTLQQQTSQLQTSTSTLQRSTGQLQTRTSSNYGSSWGSWSNTGDCTWDNSGSNRRECRYNWGSWSNVSSCSRSYSTNTSHDTDWNGNGTDCQYTAWSAWTNASSCSAVNQDTSNPYSVGTARQCQSAVSVPYANTTSCTATTTPNGSGQTTQCQYTAWGAWSNVSSCSAISQDTTNPYSVGTARQCQSAVSVPYANTGSCTVTTTPNGSGQTTQCQYAWQTLGTSSCSAPAYVAGNYSNATVYNNCQTVVTTPYANAGSCTATTIPDGSGFTTQCQYTPWSAWANVSSCAEVLQSSDPSYTTSTAVNCQTTDTGWVGTGSCTAGVTGGQTVNCQTYVTGPDSVSSCTPQTAGSGNGWLQRTCNPTTISGPTGVASCTPVSATAGNGWTATTCNTVTTGPTVLPSCTPQPANDATNYLAINCAIASSTGGTSDTLADVAEYYYITDLRTTALSNCTGSPVAPATTGNTLCAAPDASTGIDIYNNVPAGSEDTASWQHMTSFTLGLGVSGYMQFSTDYASETSGDFYDVKLGTTANPSGGICSWQASGACNWPTPADSSQTNIDDLWHAAVNGRGSYFSATDPNSLQTGLAAALAGVTARKGAAAAATTSNPNIIAGDNFIFSSTFFSQDWVGELQRRQINADTGVIQTAIDWSAQAKLDARTTRTIYTYSSDTGAWPDRLKPFVWANLTTAPSGGEQAYFIAPNISTLSQFCASGATCISAADRASAAGANLVNFLRGDQTNEGILTDKYYRQRSHILGDIVNAEAVYVKTPLRNYADYGYSSYKASLAARQGMVYTAANDGMLHAFNATDGEEAWAFIPSLVLPNLYKLADKNYASLHQYYVDGTPVVGDVCISNCTNDASAVWKTILVGGLNRGGRGYYALDITDPAAPKALWEYTHANMGYTFGNPKITKLANGTWVVLVTSGYNNVSPGDGQGRLYVLNAYSGTLATSVNPSGSIPGTIATGEGSDIATIAGVCTTTPCPSGLAQIAVRTVSSSDNTARAVYGGDLYGNLWRFDINNNLGTSPNYRALKLATLRGPSPANNVQPITTKPEIGTVSGVKVVFVGTGSYLGTGDLGDLGVQTMYAIKDNLSGEPSYGNPRTYGGFVQQTMTNADCPIGTPTTVCKLGQRVRTTSNNTVDFSTNNGWYVDMPDSGERINTNPALGLGIMTFVSNIPNNNACSFGGDSYFNFLDYRTGSALSTLTSRVGGVRIGNELATRPVLMQLLSGQTMATVQGSGGGLPQTFQLPDTAGNPAARRVTWRELIME